MNTLPKVSVVTITYGHSRYILDTIEGVIMQHYNGPIQFIIANDSSPDNTHEIVKEYFAKNSVPENFEILYARHETNKGMKSNLIWALQQATGKYIALCEGDDYWTHSHKLEKQVKFLEDNMDYMMVCTNFDSCLNNVKPDVDKELNLLDILERNPIGTQTVMFRAALLKLEKPAIFNYDFSMSDYQTWLWIASFSKVYKLGCNTAHYRILQDSASGRSNFVKKLKFDLDILEVTKYFLETSNLSRKQKKKVLRERYGYLFRHLLDHSNKSFLKYQLIYLKDIKFFNLLDIKILLKGIRIYFKSSRS